jgi:hypothetical protein
LPDDHADHPADGMRQVAGVARRRRISGAAAAWPSPRPAPGSP